MVLNSKIRYKTPLISNICLIQFDNCHFHACMLISCLMLLRIDILLLYYTPCLVLSSHLLNRSDLQGWYVQYVPDFLLVITKEWILCFQPFTHNVRRLPGQQGLTTKTQATRALYPITHYKNDGYDREESVQTIRKRNVGEKKWLIPTARIHIRVAAVYK